MSYVFNISESTEASHVKEMKEKLDELSSNGSLLVEENYRFSFKTQLLFISVIIGAWLLFSWLSITNNAHIITQTDLALRLGDEFTISKISTFNFKIMFFPIIVGVVAFGIAGICHNQFLKEKRDYLELNDHLDSIIENGDFSFKEKKEYELNGFSDDSPSMLVLLLVFAFGIFYLFMSSDQFEGYLKEHQDSGSFVSLHFDKVSWDKYTLFVEQDDKIVELKVPRRVPVTIYKANKNEKARFDYYYRTHDDFIFNEKKRSVDYYFNIYLPEGKGIEGSKMR